MGLPFVCKNTVCSDCKAFHLKDPFCGGDYTVEGKLMSYCPVCGGMLPYLDHIDFEQPITISNTKRRSVGTKIAQIYDLDFRKMYRLIKEIEGDDFVEGLRFRLRLIFDIDVPKDEIEGLV